jgi:hypothetical protein
MTNRENAGALPCSHALCAITSRSEYAGHGDTTYWGRPLYLMFSTERTQIFIAEGPEFEAGFSPVLSYARDRHDFLHPGTILIVEDLLGLLWPGWRRVHGFEEGFRKGVEFLERVYSPGAGPPQLHV